jgi:hypothetical protein
LGDFQSDRGQAAAAPRIHQAWFPDCVPEPQSGIGERLAMRDSDRRSDEDSPSSAPEKPEAIAPEDPHKTEKLAKHGREDFDTDEASD